MVQSVTPQEARRLQEEEGFLYLDVRTEEEFKQGHPEKAVLIPAFFAGEQGFVPNPAFLSTVEKHFPKETKLLVGCKSGGRSLKAAEMLKSAGYQNVLNVSGGFAGAPDPQTGEVISPGWKDLGLPVETGGELLK